MPKFEVDDDGLFCGCDWDEDDDYNEDKPYERKHNRFLQIPLDKAKVVNRVGRGMWVTESNHFLEMLICYRWFNGDKERLNELNPDIFRIYDFDWESLVWKNLENAAKRVKIAKPRLIFFTRDEINAINNAKLTQRQKRLVKVFVGLMKSRDMCTIWRLPKFSSLCHAAKVKYGRGMIEFLSVLQKSGLFLFDDDLKITLNINHRDDDEILEIFKDIYEIY